MKTLFISFVIFTFLGSAFLWFYAHDYLGLVVAIFSGMFLYFNYQEYRKTKRSNKIKKCNHKFVSDGGQCIKCGKTMTDILSESQK